MYTLSALGSPQLTTRVRLVQWEYTYTHVFICTYTYTYIFIYTSSRLHTVCPWVSTANDSCKIS